MHDEEPEARPPTEDIASIPAAQAMRSLRLPKSVIESAARAAGHTPESLLTALVASVARAGLEGDLAAAQEARSLLLGPLLRLDRARSAHALHRRLLRALGQGVLTPGELKLLLSVVEQRRHLDADVTSERLREVEGTLLARGGQ